MLPLAHGSASVLAMQNGAYQKAHISVYDATATGHPLIISFTNSNIIQGSLTVTKSCTSSETLELGCVISDELRFKVKSSILSSLDLTGQVISMYIEWSYDGNPSHLDSVYAFAGVITEVKSFGDDMYQVTAYDAMVIFDQPYSATDINVTYPITALDLFKAIAWTIGPPYVEQNVLISAATPVNTTVSISGIDETSGYTYRQVLKWLAQLMGVNVRMSPSATHPLEFWLWKNATTDSDTEDAIKLSSKNYYRLNYEKVSYSISGVTIENGDTVLYEYGYDRDSELPIMDNPVLLQLHRENTSSNWSAIGGNIKDAVYNAIGANNDRIDASCTSMWYLMPGDRVSGSLKNGTPIFFVVTSVTHKLNGSSQVIAKVTPTTDLDHSAMSAFSAQQQNQLNTLLGKENAVVGGFTPTNANSTVVYQSVRQVGSIVYVAMGIQLPAVFGRQNVTLGTLTGVDAPGNTIAVSACVTTGNTTAYNPASVIISAGGYVALVCNEQNDTTVWINTCYQAPLS